MKILVTGATGFIGKSLIEHLRNSGFQVRAALRRKNNESPINYEAVEVGDIGSKTDWRTALSGIETVIHLAGRAHILKEKNKEPLTEFMQVNAFGTQRLALMAAEAGVKRFIFISSIKVNGEGRKKPYTENDVPEPQDAYGISKREAERLLLDIASKTVMEMVILRLPLVYGPGVKANFRNLIKLANSGIPLPFKSIHNQRSFLYIGNLLNAISACINHPKAAGETFLVSDVQDISTPDLLKMIAQTMNKKVTLFSLPSSVLKIICKILGKQEELEKLTGTLLIDSTKIKNLLGWKPPFLIEEGIQKTVKNI